MSSSKVFLLSTLLVCTGAFPEKRPSYSARRNPAPAPAPAFSRPPSPSSAYDTITPGYDVAEPSSPGGYERRPSNGYGATNSAAEEGPANYDFTYSVVDEASGNNYGQSESRDGTVTKGTYYVQLPDGRLQRVDYSVDGDSGFVATVTYEGEARYDTQTSNNVQDQYGAPSQPEYGPPPQQDAVQPQYGAPAQPEYNTPVQPEYGAPAQAKYGAPPPQPSPPGYAAPTSQPEYGVRAQPQYNPKPVPTQQQYG